MRTENTSPKMADVLAAEVRRLTGCLLAIAGSSSECGGGSIRTAAFEAASMGASPANLARKLGLPETFHQKWESENG